MVIDLLMVQMWFDQFKKIPPTNLDDLPEEAKIAWALILKSLRR